jgi:hypothetical protein
MARIHIGMTEIEVEDILGCPGIRPPITSKRITITEGPGVAGIHKYWTGRRAIIGVKFDQDFQVAGKSFHKVPEPHFIDRLRDWLDW